MRTKFIAVLAVLCAAVFLSYSPREYAEPQTVALQTMPAVIGQWTSVSNVLFNAPTLRVLRPTDYVMRTYRNTDGEHLGLYVGYHGGGPDAGPIHSPRNCLPGSGWHLLEEKRQNVVLDSGTITLVRAAYAKGGELMTCYYWYLVRGATIASDYALKWSELTGMLLHQRKDASFIRLDLRQKASEHTDLLVQNFLQHGYPLLKQHLPS